MSQRPPIACALVLLVSLAGCGGSSHPSTASSSSTAAKTAIATTPTSSSTARDQTTRPPAHTSTAGASNVHLPATFTIRAGGALSPPAVTAPVGVPIELTLVSGDGRPHQVVLRAPQRRTLTVPAGGRASALISGLKTGRYPLDVDGAARGALVVGGQPGP